MAEHPMSKPHQTDALNLASRIAKSELSVREATEAAIATIEKQNSVLNAVV